METLLHDKIHVESGSARPVRQDEIDTLRAALTDRDAEIERLRADLVWAVKHDTKHRLNVRRFIDEDNGSRLVWHEAPGWSAKFVEIPAGSGDAGILAALRRVVDGSSNGVS